MTTKRKIGIILSYFFQFLMLLYTILSFLQKQYLTFFVGLISFFLTFLPMMVRRRFDVSLPWILNFFIVFALYLNLAGAYMNWYIDYYPIYDKFGHFFGSVTIALLSFAYVAIIGRYTKLNFDRLNAFMFIIIFTLALGALWEIGEFTADQIFGTMNQPNLIDTMLDLIFDLIGGTFVAFLTYFNFDKMKEKIITIGRR